METLTSMPRTFYSYQEFFDLAESLAAENKTTGPNQSEAMIEYSKLNVQRLGRVNKTVELDADLVEMANALKKEYLILAIVEAWCGDVPSNLPVWAKLADSSSQLEMKCILRDENLDIIDQHLTNGGRAIPKVVVFEKGSGKTVAEWGPRPAPAQKMVMDYKAIEGEKKPYSEFQKDLQLWYAKDRGKTLMAEMKEMLGSWS
jgi:hypothetical protein